MYEEVFKRVKDRVGPGRVFYTITREDVGKRTVIRTTAGPISIGEVLGRVRLADVGRRLYRVPCDDPAAGWVWQAENDDQREKRREQEIASLVKQRAEE